MSGVPDEKLGRLLVDLAGIAEDAAHVVTHGRDAYLADDPTGRLLRNAGERIVIKVSTVVERLPAEYKDARPDVEWTKLQRMRNLIAHHYDKVQADFVWATLVRRVPDLARRPLGQDEGDGAPSS